NNDQAASIGCPILDEEILKCVDVIVRELVDSWASKPPSHDCAVVDRSVVYQQVPRAHQVANRGDIGGMPADHCQGRLRAMEFGEALLQFAVEPAFASNQAAGRYRCTEGLD